MLMAGARWYAVYTKAKDEERAENNLKAWGVETFAPKIQERQHNQFTNIPRYVTKPLFPRYIFARFDAAMLLRKVYYTRGVHSVVSLEYHPVIVEDDVIAMIKERVNEDGFVKIGEELRPNDKVVIKSGVLKNFTGVFERRMKDSDRIMIMLTTISFQGHICIEEEQVRKLLVLNQISSVAA
jgi:transcription elongation factor/antiterminator RfaH